MSKIFGDFLRGSSRFKMSVFTTSQGLWEMQKPCWRNADDFSYKSGRRGIKSKWMGGSSRGCRVPRRGGHLDQLPAVYTWPAYSNALYYNFDLSHFHSKYFSSSIQDFPLCKYFLIWYVHKCLVLSSYSNALCFNFDWMHIPIAFIIFQCKSQNRKMPQSKNPRLPGWWNWSLSYNCQQ